VGDCGMVQVYEGNLADDATVHDAVMDLHCCNDCERYSLREGTSTEGGDEGDGSQQQCALGVVVHHKFYHDAVVSLSPCHCTQGIPHCFN